jgi:DEAD/DEAH box helicase domain-containing protein
MLPTILAKQLEIGIRDYIETTFPMANEPFRGSIKNMLNTKDSVYHEPYVAVRLPYRVAEKMPDCFEAIHPTYLPYVHQELAFERLTGNDGKSTLIATGTGSGKTECFLYPILEYCYQHRGEKGIKALIIYPMNALATDQARRIADIIYNSQELRGNITVGMYVGGHENVPSRMMSADGVITDHDTLLNTPPDVLMTNYKMLDYLLVRPKDASLWKDNDPDTLKYIAVDELHTFDGAQGTDLACLLRRLKSRLWTPSSGYLCCIGTSATMGSKDNGKSILEYASEIFGEPFDENAIVTEDRLSPQEFFAGSAVTDFTIPSNKQIKNLLTLERKEDEVSYIKAAAKAWIDLGDLDVTTDEGKIQLGQKLMHHSFVQSMVSFMRSNFCKVSVIVEELSANYPDLRTVEDPEEAVNALIALISYARTGSGGHLRPFLAVQVQLWMRELRRLVGKVSPDKVTYAIAHDLNAQQKKHFLPIVNCRECGATGWASILNERQNTTLTSLETFYNLYFRADSKIVMMFPHQDVEIPHGFIKAGLCPNCLKLRIGQDVVGSCDSCGTDMVEVILPNPIKTTGSKKHPQFVCPFCGSKRGLSLMGLRSATEISACISQLFGSKFNDDKKALAFSDNVQDASHRAGFFNARTWRFGFRTALQHYVKNGGAGQSLSDFTKGFIDYWHQRIDDESFVGFFIAPNMTWMKAYEDMVQKRKLGKDDLAVKLMSDIEKRISYEIMLEYGLTSRIGRTLEKSSCSCLAFPTNELLTVADRVQERVKNEIGNIAFKSSKHYGQMIAGYVNLMRQSGAFEDKAFSQFLAENGNTYLLSSDHVSWMPGRQSGRNTPRFIYKSDIPSRKNANFDVVSDRKYTDWISSFYDGFMIDSSTFVLISQVILDELVKSGLVVEIQTKSNYVVYGLNKSHVYITDKVLQLKCDTCGIGYSVAEDNKTLWEGAPCTRHICSGSLAIDSNDELDYYGKLFTFGDIARINAREHTGLLERDEREELERDFKRTRGEQKIWDPNVLSCTPTLEMGIDIGDLSSVILCSMPPAQAQFLQRTGRAGRKDGNALTLAIAAARPHDLYFYADPLDMIEGNVQPPKIFLKASAVLERQFVAFCMDSWVKKDATEQSIPRNVGIIIGKLESHPKDLFPFNFLTYVQNNLTHLLNSFIQMFIQYLDDTAKAEIKKFALGEQVKQSPMHMRVLEAFQSLKKQRDSLFESINQLKEMVKNLQSKPKDFSYEEDIKELKLEQAALMNVLKELNRKDVFNFLSDEGLLPNYAFPEAGIVLKAVLYRKDEAASATSDSKKQYHKSVYEYSRSAASAISEFAPNNSFYVDGRKLTIDQIDLSSAQIEKWRLCPNCSHAELEEKGKHTSCCPQCGSTGWADSGQVRNMLKVQMVYSNTDYTKSLISDESDDRSNVFYCKQLLVDVDEDHDIYSAYQMDNAEFSFGYEFVKKATLREINFGESDVVGEKFPVSGIEEVRKGFKICRYCGKIQPNRGPENHTFYCKSHKLTLPNDAEDPFIECLFLYREFTTEALRILIPATTMDSTKVRTESFTAAFMLGMREYFGNVDHLRATVSEVPVPDTEYRKQYLVIYDSVPGGTGYLKQLMNEKASLIDILEKALQKLEQCSCKEDPQKDGCYHCLYAYRQSKDIGNISRRAAIRMLKAILSGKDNLTKIPGLASVPVNSLFDSELERRFVEAIAQMGNENRKVDMSKSLISGKEGYILKIGDKTWEIEPQVLLDATQGVSVTCKPDFIIRPVGKLNKLPVAIFTDGFIYHKDKVADDTVKREAILRSGRYRVWSFSWKDVQSAFAPQGDYCTPTLNYEKMPCGHNVYQPIVKTEKAESIKVGTASAMELLMEYLEADEADKLFKAHARGIALSLLEPQKAKSTSDFDRWKVAIEEVNDETHFTDNKFEQSGTLFGTWIPRSDNVHLRIYAGVLLDKLKENRKTSASVCAVLDDCEDSRTDKYEQEWNGFWQFCNVMQFNDQFVAVCDTGLKSQAYTVLPYGDVQSSVTDDISPEVSTEGWSDIKSLLFDDVSKKIADRCSTLGIPAPEEVGYELVDMNDEVIAEVELAWTKRKIGFMTEDQKAEIDKAKALGWKIFTTLDEIEVVFGEV